MGGGGGKGGGTGMLCDLCFAIISTKELSPRLVCLPKFIVSHAIFGRNCAGLSGVSVLHNTQDFVGL